MFIAAYIVRVHIATDITITMNNPDKIKEEIVSLRKDKPKMYVKLIDRDPVLKSWVKENSLIGDSFKLVEQIHSAISQETNVCSLGKVKKYRSPEQGFGHCGPAKVCPCAKAAIAAGVSNTKRNLPAEQKAIANAKRAATNKAQTGYEYASQRPDVKEKLSGPKIDLEAYNKLTDFNWMEDQYVTQQRSLVDIADELNVYYGTVGEYCRSHGFKIRQRSCYSLAEKKIGEYIESLGLDVIYGDWDILDSTELDLVIPSAKLAIEVNGLHWHSWNPCDARSNSKSEDRFRHYRKTAEAAKKGYQLLHFTDYEWNNRQEQVKSIICTKLGLNSRVYARKCSIVNVSTAQARTFIDNYHLQGFASASHYYGLEYMGYLVMMLTVQRSRFDGTGHLEIIRVCSKNGISVVGGLSKLLAHARLENPGQDIITYCDASISAANGYIKAGMELVELSDPGYFWTDGNQVFSRFQCQRKNLAKWLLTFDPLLSEAENMFNAKYRRYWNCGNYKLILKH